MNNSSRLFNRNFYLLWQGQSVSRLGDQLYQVALMLWVKHLTDSATVIGLMLMFSALPSILLSAFGGTAADRYPRRKILVVTDTILGLAVCSLAAFIYFFPNSFQGSLTLVFIVAVIISIGDAFFQPAITASIPDLVPTGKVAKANSLAQFTYQLSVFVGQGSGGVLFRLVGAPILFLVNGISYLVAAASEATIEIPQNLPDRSTSWKHHFREFKDDVIEGLRYVVARPGLRELVILSAVLNFFMIPIVVLLPFYVEDTLRVVSDWYGYLLAAFGVGALMGYVLNGVLSLSGKARAGVVTAFLLVQPVGFILLGLTRLPWQAVGLFAAGGLMSGFVTVSITTVLQLTTPVDIRGRIFGVLGTIAGSITPIGMGITGIIADLLNQNIALVYRSAGVLMLLCTILILLRRETFSFLAHNDETGPVHVTVKKQAAWLE